MDTKNTNSVDHSIFVNFEIVVAFVVSGSHLWTHPRTSHYRVKTPTVSTCAVFGKRSRPVSASSS
jgi:hypothetical protein